MSKLIEHGDIAKERAVTALDKISAIVGSTLGPSGSPVLLTRETSAKYHQVFHTKDGITVLRELQFSDPVEDAVHKLAIQASTDTVIQSGDGPFPESSQVLTPNGFIKMKDLQVGMEICGTDGSFQTVLGVFPKGEKKIYEVEFSNNRIIECSGDHLWTVTRTSNNVFYVETKTTKELQKDYLSYTKNNHKKHKYYTPRTVVEFKNNEDQMPLDPYLVGVLLGDGSLSGTGSIELSLGNKKEHIIDKLILPEGFTLTSTYVPSKNSYRVKIKGKNSDDDTIPRVVESIGLLGTSSNTKFIPKSYLYSSIKNRTKLLQGLIDTDGYINKSGGIEFSSISEELAFNFVDLCRSLGKTVNILKHERKEGGSYSMTPIYRVHASKGPQCGNKILRIEATGKSVPMMCIKVSNPDHLYIIDHYIVTHNTTSTLLLASAFAKELRNAGQNNPQSAIRKFRKEINSAIECIGAETVKGLDAEFKVAITSSNSDEDLAFTVMEALKHTSAYGTVVVEKSTLNKDRFTIDKEFGYQAGTGYAQHNDLGISISDNAVTNGEFSMENIFVIPYNGQIIHFDQVIEFIRKVSVWHGNNFKLLFVCYDFSDEIVYKLIQFNRQNPSKAFIIKTNATAEYNGAWQQLNDIASFSGSRIIDAGTLAADFTKEDLGGVKKARISPYKTFLLGMPTTNWVAKRAEQNQTSLDLAPTQLDKDIISSRNSSLTGGLVKIIVGGGIPSELGETADRVDDAVRAVQACRRSGALPGAGLSYIRAASLANVSTPVANALHVIHKTIMANYGEVPLQSVEQGEVIRISDNSVDRGNFLELGIADSFETVKSVILNGFALGSLIANLGGYAVRQNLEELRQQLQLKQIMES